MKVDYKINEDGTFDMIFKELSGFELDSIRIVLLTVCQHGQNLNENELGLDKLIELHKELK